MMISSRENPQNTLALRDILARAFSRRICGLEVHNRFNYWFEYLLTNTEQKAILEHQKTLAESKKVKPGNTIKLNRFSPTLYCILWEKFSEIHKLPTQNNILDIIGHSIRAAASLDVVEHLEAENDYYKKSLVELKTSLSLAHRPDFDSFQTNKKHLEEKLSLDYQTHIKNSTLQYFREKIAHHENEEKLLIEEIEHGEDIQDPAKLKKFKNDLLEKISRNKETLKTDFSLVLDKKTEHIDILAPFTRTGFFKTVRDDYNNLNKQIMSIDQHYEKQQQKSEIKTIIPIIHAQTLEELHTIQNTSAFERKIAAERLKRIEKIFDDNNPYWLSYPEEWKELKTLVINQQTIWLQEKKDLLANRDNISIRVQQLQQHRAQLIKQQHDEETSRIRQAETEQYYLADEIRGIRELYEQYCRRNNQALCTVFKSTCRENTTLYKQMENKYDALRKRVSAIDAPRPIEKKASSIITSPPTSQSLSRTEHKHNPAPVTSQTPQKGNLNRAKASAVAGTIALGGAAAAIALVTFPVGWIVGGLFALIGILSWVDSIISCKNSGKKTNAVSIPLLPIKESKDDSESTQEIRHRLGTPNPHAARARAFGLNPDKAQQGKEGSMHFSLTDGKLLHFSSEGIRLYSANRRIFTQITAAKIPKEIGEKIPDQCKLRA